eukprot:2977820-Pleurochrysis_carterae.AAC.1
MRLEVLRLYLLARLALIPYYHAPALYCKALPLLLQRASAATTVARHRAGLWVKRELLTTGTASYSLRTARNVGVFDSEPFRSATIQGYRGSRKNLKNNTKAKENAKRRKKIGMQYLKNFPTMFPIGQMAAKYQVPGLLWQAG